MNVHRDIYTQIGYTYIYIYIHMYMYTSLDIYISTMDIFVYIYMYTCTAKSAGQPLVFAWGPLPWMALNLLDAAFSQAPPGRNSVARQAKDEVRESLCLVSDGEAVHHGSRKFGCEVQRLHVHVSRGLAHLTKPGLPSTTPNF